jgi:peptidyl-prolyl cis-trans isomerase A (cyclophilin A)
MANERKLKLMFRSVLAAVAAATAMTGVLTGCGGSTEFPPVITAVKVQSMLFGRTATINLGGKDLRSSLVVNSGGACIEPSFSANSSTDVLVLNCTVKKVGDFALDVQDANGKLIYSTTLTVPKPQVALIMASGSITLELDPIKAPATVDNFLYYVRQGYYSNTLFHRVIPGFVVQGGGYTTGMVKKAGQVAPIVLETSLGGPSNLRTTVAMARTNVANSATSEFFINLVDNTFLDFRSTASPGYAVFGTVVKGMDQADLIATQPTGVVSGFTDVPLTEVAISMALQVQ